ncbi:MAG: hypothetical protein R3C03_04395 [Pirellulaceae bacterium]
MEKKRIPSEPKNVTEQQQRENLAANLAFLIVQAHRHGQYSAQTTADVNEPAQTKTKGKTRHIP